MAKPLAKKAFVMNKFFGGFSLVSAPLADCITSVGRRCQLPTSKKVIRACKTIGATKLNRGLELSKSDTSTDKENNNTELEDLHAGKRLLRINHSESKLS